MICSSGPDALVASVRAELLRIETSVRYHQKAVEVVTKNSGPPVVLLPPVLFFRGQL